jgi:hypothetical protein
VWATEDISHDGNTISIADRKLQLPSVFSESHRNATIFTEAEIFNLQTYNLSLKLCLHEASSKTSQVARLPASSYFPRVKVYLTEFKKQVRF